MVPFILGIGGTTRPNSSTEKAIRVCLKVAAANGAETLLLGAADLQLPLYEWENQTRTKEAARLVEEARRADGIVLASPGYHGTISGLVKNGVDYFEDMNKDPRPYFDGRAVGCIAVASGWQASVTTLTALRSIVHALRGWPTPVGVALNSTVKLFDDDGNCLDENAKKQLELMGQQVFQFARMQMAMKS